MPRVKASFTLYRKDDRELTGWDPAAFADVAQEQTLLASAPRSNRGRRRQASAFGAPQA